MNLSSRIENLENLPVIERLGFRWNFIKTIENVSHLTTLQVSLEQLNQSISGENPIPLISCLNIFKANKVT